MIKYLSLCDGISCGFMAISRLRNDIQYHAVETDKYCRQLSDNNFSGIVRWQNDVTKITREDIKKNWPFDIVTFGPPCQSVSVAGKKEGLNGTSGLLIDCVQILRWCQEDNPDLKYIIENVKMSKKFLKQFNMIIGHEGTLINAALVSGQSRERWYWTNLKDKLEQPEDKNIFFRDVLETGSPVAVSKSTRYVDKEGKVFSNPNAGRESKIEKRERIDGKSHTLKTGDGCNGQSSANFVFLSEKEKEYMDRKVHDGRSHWDFGHHHDAKKDKSQCLSSNIHKGVPYNVLIDGFGDVRKLTVRECAKLQTIPEVFDFSSVSKTQAYKAIGNGWCVDVIVHIFKQLGLDKK